jgi:RNA polymerase sigma factor (sigma-70 family)
VPDAERQRREFAEFYRAVIDPLRAYVYSLSPTADIEALANEACTRTFSRWDSISGSRRAWAFRVAHNLVRDSYRGKPAIPMPPGALPDKPSSRFAGPELSYELLELLNAINGLPPSLREPMLLAAQQLDPQEIASVLDLRPRTVSKYLYRARVRLVRQGLLDRKPPPPNESPPTPDQQADRTPQSGTRHA